MCVYARLRKECVGHSTPSFGVAFHLTASCGYGATTAPVGCVHATHRAVARGMFIVVPARRGVFAKSPRLLAQASPFGGSFLSITALRGALLKQLSSVRVCWRIVSLFFCLLFSESGFWTFSILFPHFGGSKAVEGLIGTTYLTVSRSLGRSESSLFFVVKLAFSVVVCLGRSGTSDQLVVVSVSTARKHPVNGGSHRYLAGVMTPGLQRRNATSSQHAQGGCGCEH